MENGRRSSNHRFPKTEKFWREQPRNGFLRPKKKLKASSESVADIPSERADPGAHPDVDYPRPGLNADAVDLRVIKGLGSPPRSPGQVSFGFD